METFDQIPIAMITAAATTDTAMITAAGTNDTAMTIGDELDEFLRLDRQIDE